MAARGAGALACLPTCGQDDASTLLRTVASAAAAAQLSSGCHSGRQNARAALREVATAIGAARRNARPAVLPTRAIATVVPSGATSATVMANIPLAPDAITSALCTAPVAPCRTRTRLT